MVYSYLEKKPELYSDFVALIDKAGLKGMLSAYGAYTCLAPTNDAFQIYYKSFGPNFNLDSMTTEQVDYLAKTHIVDNKYITSNLDNGVLPNPNMNKRYITFEIKADTIEGASLLLLNDSSQIISRDNIVYNGVVQGINRVLQPSNTELPKFIKANDNLSIFSEALELTGLADSLLLTKDFSYKPTKVFKDEYNQYDIVTPDEKKYGYTAFIEPNSVYQQHRINDINDLILKAREIYGDKGHEDNYKHRENSLNIFIAYHLVKKAIQLNKFFYTSDAIKGHTPDEFIETMYPNRIIKASMIGSNITLNPTVDYEAIINQPETKVTINGVYYLLDNLLIYNSSNDNMLQNTRIRFDIVSLFPEMANNNIRGSRDFMKINNSSGDRFGFEDGYLKDITMSQDTRLIYLASKEGQWANFQSDELMGLGSYDIAMRLLPVPPGTYELRFAYSANSLRSVTQIYIDGKPVGIPLDLRIQANEAKIGWLLDNETEDEGVENDKMMKNRGYMKGPITYYYGETLARNYSGCLRRVIGTFTFADYSAHTVRFKSVIEKNDAQLMMDYFEFVPKNIFNPVNGEPESRE
jgi:uncharacterized surface protein with fasciclin (FAS1) repeats